jgi:L-asparagine transporter-like permease
MLFSLSRGGYLPKAIGRISKNGVPHRALIASTGGMIAAILLAIFVPGQAFLLLYGVAVAGMFFVWGVILMTHLSFRRKLSPARIAALPIRLPLSPFAEIVGVAALVGLGVSTFFVEGMRHTVPAFVPFLVIVSIVYWRLRRKQSGEVSLQ